jgi:hypothetical protein
LGVRYLLEGSVRRSANRVRINTQLIDAETDAHLWAERFDVDTEDLFVLQDEVTRRIAFALDLELISAEATYIEKHLFSRARGDKNFPHHLRQRVHYGGGRSLYG